MTDILRCRTGLWVPLCRDILPAPMLVTANYISLDVDGSFFQPFSLICVNRIIFTVLLSIFKTQRKNISIIFVV